MVVISGHPSWLFPLFLHYQDSRIISSRELSPDVVGLKRSFFGLNVLKSIFTEYTILASQFLKIISSLKRPFYTGDFVSPSPS